MKKARMPAHGNQKYPWKRWEDGGVHRAVRGRHFSIDMKPESFRRALSVRAKRRGLKVETSVKGQVVAFRFVKAEAVK